LHSDICNAISFATIDFHPQQMNIKAAYVNKIEKKIATENVSCNGIHLSTLLDWFSGPQVVFYPPLSCALQDWFMNHLMMMYQFLWC